uniref:Uncharacterized protein n=1 Tax=Parastrongyloides trichosuri TaxID=131310 RepID=A0A0N4ZDS4_PARTI
MLSTRYIVYILLFLTTIVVSSDSSSKDKDSGANSIHTYSSLKDKTTTADVEKDHLTTTTTVVEEVAAGHIEGLTHEGNATKTGDSETNFSSTLKYSGFTMLSLVFFFLIIRKY